MKIVFSTFQESRFEMRRNEDEKVEMVHEVHELRKEVEDLKKELEMYKMIDNE